MHIPEDFIPDFKYNFTTGLICNRSSKIQCRERDCYVSVYNRINVWNFSSAELVLSFGERNHTISKFLIHENGTFVGYEDGTLEIFPQGMEVSDVKASKTVKIHTKRITGILLINDNLVTSSMDGTIACYDLVLDEVNHYYKGNNTSVESLILLEGEKICAVCADKCLKIWKLEEETLLDAIAFEEYLFDAVSKGGEALVFFRSGQSCFVDLRTKERKSFEKFKNIRNVCFKNNVLCVQTQNKTSIFNSTKTECLGLAAKARIDSSSKFTSIDLLEDEPCFLSLSNLIVCGDLTIDFGFHENEIIEIKTDRSKVYSLSKDRFICWDRNAEEQTLTRNCNIKLKNATGMCQFREHICIGTQEGVQVFDKKCLELKNHIGGDKVSCVCSSENALAVCTADQITFFNKDFTLEKSTTAPAMITHARFTPDGTFFLFSCMDNKIYQFGYPALDHRLTLYGHSLPVRQFSISTDQKLLISCGADKLVKLWGLEFGECRKTFIGNSTSAEFLSDRLFMFTDKHIQYFNHFDSLKKFRLFNPGILALGTDYFVASTGRGVSLFSMEKYEFIQEEDSGEAVESVVGQTETRGKNYDTFLGHVERLEEDFSEANLSLFYEFLERSDFNDLKEYLHVLDYSTVRLILTVLEKKKEENVLVNARIFLCLVKNHFYACQGMNPEIHRELFSKVKAAKELFNKNLARVEIDIHKNESINE